MSINQYSSDLKKKEKALYKLYVKLGKLTSYYIDKNINFISYIKKAKQIDNKIKGLTSSIKKLKKDINKYNKEIKNSIENKKQEFTQEGYGIYKFCPKCLKGNNPNSKVCNYCGEKFNK